ncbi:MAG: sialidase family protein [Trueperaceae bacterium]
MSAIRKRHQPRAGSRPTGPRLFMGLILVSVAGLSAWWGLGRGDGELGRLGGDLHSLHIAVDGGIIYGQHGGIQVSSDGGMTWTAPSGTGDAMAIAAGTADPDTIYQAGHGLFLKSTDGGKTWQEPGFGNLPSTDIHGFSVAPDSGDLYANVAGRGLHLSRDEGKFWEFKTSATADAMTLAAGPGEPPVVYALSMSQGPIRSDDGGETWRRIGGVAEPSMSGIYVHPESGNLYLTGVGGVYRSADRGASWEALGPNAPMALVASAANDERTLVAVAQNGQVYRSDDGGGSWQE